jgi:hypothetical protein
VPKESSKNKGFSYWGPSQLFRGLSLPQLIWLRLRQPVRDEDLQLFKPRPGNCSISPSIFTVAESNSKRILASARWTIRPARDSDLGQM